MYRRWFNRIGVRIVVFLSLALLPVGLIAVSQTQRVNKEARANAELALIALTEQAALAERLTVQTAFGAAQALGGVIPAFRDDPEACKTYLGNFLGNNQRFVFAGVLPPSGLMTCSSTGKSYDFSESPDRKDAMNTQRPIVRVVQEGEASKQTVIIIAQPFRERGRFAGFVTISMPHSGLTPAIVGLPSEGLVNLFTFNEKGTVLTSTGDQTLSEGELPQGYDLATLTGHVTQTFSGQNANGADRIFAVVPVIDRRMYVLGVWDSAVGLSQELRPGLPPGLYPGLMWAISLVVAIFAVHRLVIRHVRQLGRQMSQFARNRHLEPHGGPSDLPTELSAMQDDFEQMAQSIMQDEAQLEDALRDKNVLLKEVHHRVKNNLQLISSIMNLQIRKTRNSETKAILRRLQDRVLSLATIHRDLYRSQNSGQVNVGSLVREIVGKSLDIGIDSEMEINVESEIEDVFLYPDQAVPMSLLVSEAMTNALKHVGTSPAGKRHIRVTLHREQEQERHCVLVFTNSVGEDTVPGDSTGLGSQLIKAFVTQLGADIDIEQTDRLYRMTVRFAAVEFMPHPVDF